MKFPGLPTSAWLLAIGATATLLIGAFAHFDPNSAPKAGPAITAAPAAVADQEGPAESAGEPDLPADLSPGLAEIIRMAQAHVDEGVILSYVQNSGQVYAPSADEILYLSDLGLSQNVIAALFKNKLPEAPPAAQGVMAAMPALPALAPPASAATASDAAFFYNSLAPYGSWVQVPDYGLSWQPTVETINADWRPYLNQGQWLDSDGGWYWQSDYSWGWAVFHYGGWVKEPRLGWVWVPNKVWAPAWVAWRSTGAYFGWASLPPGASLSALAQLNLMGRAPAGGLAPSSFAFVSADNFLARNLPGLAVPAARAAALFAASAPVGNYSIVNNRIINGGIRREAVAAAARKAVQPVTLRAVSSPAAVAGVANRGTLAVYRPDVSAAGPEAASPAGPFLLNKPRAQPAQTPPAPQENAALLADVPPAQSSVLPARLETVEPLVQLPPLRYGALPRGLGTHVPSAVGNEAALAPRRVHPQGQADLLGGVDGAAEPRRVHHQWNNRLDPVERPVTAPPRLEGETAGARPAAPAVETRRTVEEPRPAPAEPVRVAAAPAAASSKAAK